MNESAAVNPLLPPARHPCFDLIRAEHAVPAVRQALAAAQAQLDALERDPRPTWEGLFVPLRELDRSLDFAWSLVHHYMSVLNSDAWRVAEKELQPDVVAFSLRAGQSQPIYGAMQALRQGDQWNHLSSVQQRIVASSLRSMRLAGVGLPEAERTEFNDLQRQLAELGTRFQNNVLDATKAFALTLNERADVEGLPESALRAAARSALAAGEENATAEQGPWRITLEAPSFLPFMKYGCRRDLRETLYRAYVTRASSGNHDNSDIIIEMLRLRRRAAELLGFPSYAHLSIERKMADSPAAVEDLLLKLRSAAQAPARTDLADIQALADESDPATGRLQNWDVAFWSERLRERRFDYNDEALRPYFQFPRVLEGLFALTRDLFEVEIVPDDGAVPVWHEDVRFFRIRRPGGQDVASFYLDPYSRPETKRGGAWMTPAAPRERMRDSGLELPVVYLICNQTRPDGDTPSLMTFGEVTTLFHEFGHGLQHMLTMVDEPEAAGIHNIEWDAVELASQFMENWCYHQPTLTGMTRHIETGEPLPDALFEKIAAARTFRAGSDMLRQLFFALLDLELHAHLSDVTADEITEAKQRIAVTTTVLPPLSDDRMLCGFAHIFAGGYAAGYYSYKWAEVLSADAFAAFEEAGLDDAEAIARVGRRYRDTILAMGGGTHPMEVFRAFRGREPDPAALLRQSGLC